MTSQKEVLCDKVRLSKYGLTMLITTRRRCEMKGCVILHITNINSVKYIFEICTLLIQCSWLKPPPCLQRYPCSTKSYFDSLYLIFVLWWMKHCDVVPSIQTGLVSAVRKFWLNIAATRSEFGRSIIFGIVN